MINIMNLFGSSCLMGGLMWSNQYVINNIPYLFRIMPGDNYYSLIKYFFLFIVIFLIIYLTLYSNTEKDKKENSTYSDTIIIMSIVLTLYFIVSLFPAIQLLKLKFETTFNVIFFSISFFIITFIYTTVFNNNVSTNNIKNTLFGVFILILFILYVIFDETLTGTIPGVNILPPFVRKLLHIAIKLNLINDSSNANIIEFNKFKQNMLSTNKISNDEFTKLMIVLKIILKSTPKTLLSVIDKFKKETDILNKLLGTVNVDSIDNIASIIHNPFVKLLLTIITIANKSIPLDI